MSTLSDTNCNRTKLDDNVRKENVTKIRGAPRPATKKQIGLFMGLQGYYQDFIRNFDAVAAPPSDLTRKEQPDKVEWSEAKDEAFQKIKALLKSKPILRLPGPNKTYFVRTNASDYRIGAVLIQEQEGTLFPICYASNTTRRHMSTTAQNLGDVKGHANWEQILKSEAFACHPRIIDIKSKV